MSSIQRLVEEAHDLPQDQRLSPARRVLELTEPAITDDVSRSTSIAGAITGGKALGYDGDFVVQ